jgi:hypothetical protein
LIWLCLLAIARNLMHMYSLEAKILYQFKSILEVT